MEQRNIDVASMEKPIANGHSRGKLLPDLASRHPVVGRGAAHRSER